MLIAITASASAQYMSALAEEQTILLGADDETVTRNWKDFSVTTSTVEKYTYISKTNYGAECSTVGGNHFPMDISKHIENIKILDFCFVDTLMFFCGYYHHPDSATCGIMGWLDIQNFQALNTTAINYHKYEKTVQLNKLVAYEIPGGIRAIAIGEYADQPYADVVIEDDYLTSSSTTTPYNQWYLASFSSTLFEKAYDILLVESNVVLVGKLSTSNFLTIRYADKNTGIAGISNMYYFTTPYEVNDFVRATPLHNQYLAVAYVHIYPSNIISNRIRVIDINEMDMVSSQEYFPNDKDEIFEMRYDSINDRLLILHPRIRMPYESSILITNPFDVTPYMAPFVFHGDQIFTSFDKIGGNILVSTGSNRWWYQDNPITISDETTCPKNDELPISIIPNMIIDNYPFLIEDPQETFLTTFDVIIMKTELDLDCSF